MPGKVATPRLKELDNILILSTRSTGLQTSDRIAGLGLIGLSRVDHASFSGESLHLLFDRPRESEPSADVEKSDGMAREPFNAYAESLAEQLRRADLIVSHNAEFDARLLNREMELASLPLIPVPTFCTLTGWRKAFPGTRSSLTAISESLRLFRRSPSANLTEDAWLTALIFFKLCEATLTLKFEDVATFPTGGSQNF
jgi:hypothetical protein